MSDWQSVRALLGGIPALPGARCAGRWDLYERTVDEYRVDGQLTRDELESARTPLCASARRARRCGPAATISARPADRAPSGRRHRRTGDHNQRADVEGGSVTAADESGLLRVGGVVVLSGPALRCALDAALLAVRPAQVDRGHAVLHGTLRGAGV